MLAIADNICDSEPSLLLLFCDRAIEISNIAEIMLPIHYLPQDKGRQAAAASLSYDIRLYELKGTNLNFVCLFFFPDRWCLDEL